VLVLKGFREPLKNGYDAAFAWAERMHFDEILARSAEQNRVPDGIRSGKLLIDRKRTTDAVWKRCCSVPRVLFGVADSFFGHF
jgi:hypothetical protein